MNCPGRQATYEAVTTAIKKTRKLGPTASLPISRARGDAPPWFSLQSKQTRADSS